MQVKNYLLFSIISLILGLISYIVVRVSYNYTYSVIINFIDVIISELVYCIVMFYVFLLCFSKGKSEIEAKELDAEREYA